MVCKQTTQLPTKHKLRAELHSLFQQCSHSEWRTLWFRRTHKQNCSQQFCTPALLRERWYLRLSSAACKNRVHTAAAAAAVQASQAQHWRAVLLQPASTALCLLLLLLLHLLLLHLLLLLCRLCSISMLVRLAAAACRYRNLPAVAALTASASVQALRA